MSVKKILIKTICIILCIGMLSAGVCGNAVILDFETQYNYDSVDVAWLTDLTVKTNLNSVSGVAQSLKLEPVTDYPYCDTADSFKEDVDYYTSMYLLNEDSIKASYIYFFDVLSSVSGNISGDVSDADILAYLRGRGISVPAALDYDSKIVARAIYTAMITGTLTASATNVSLYELAINLLESTTGISSSVIDQWLPSTTDPTLDDYILAASKYTLWSAGYDVDKSTDSSTVYRLVACKTIETYGITADSTADFNTLKLKFLAAMLYTKYGVMPDWKTLGTELENDTVAMYVLKLIAVKNGISVGSRSFSDAFLFVAGKTDVFDLDPDEFYADIYHYNIYVTPDTTAVWINPVPYNTDGTVKITADGNTLKNSYYTKYLLDATKSVETIEISVVSTLGTKSSALTYTLTVYKNAEAPEGYTQNTQLTEALDNLYLSSETLLAGILPTLGINNTVSAILDKSFEDVDTGLKDVLSTIAPTFDDGSADATAAEKTESDAITFLDKIGLVIDSDITGIDGLDLLRSSAEELIADNYISFIGS